jgi:bis(5'-nucleosyl)-tetraphosphatase (symmetrical)
MAIYAIGDVQGCYDPLCRLLEKIRFEPVRDKLWFAGDLVNRGPQSLETLRFVRKLGKCAVTVLGNHDLHMLAAYENPKRLRPKDNLERILSAPDCEELMDWLRHRPLLHHDGERGFTLVHAGIPPQWNLKRARSAARELERVLRGDHCDEFLRKMYGNTPRRWSSKLTGWARLRYITNAFTRMRFCDLDGNLELRKKGPPSPRARKYVPWFDVPRRRNKGLKIVFGHWSTLGNVKREGIYPLDTGCVWGGCLTAMRLRRRKPPVITTVKCKQVQAPTLKRGRRKRK